MEIKEQVVGGFKGFNIPEARKTAGVIITPAGFRTFKTSDDLSLLDQLLHPVAMLNGIAIGSIDSVGTSPAGKILFGVDCLLTVPIKDAVVDIATGTRGYTSVFPLNRNLLKKSDVSYYIANDKGDILKALPVFMKNARLDLTSEAIVYSKDGGVFVIGITDIVNENFSAGKFIAKVGAEIIFMDRVQEDEKTGRTKIIATTKNDGKWIHLPDINSLLQGQRVLPATMSDVKIPTIFKDTPPQALVACGQKIVGIFPNAIGIAPMMQGA